MNIYSVVAVLLVVVACAIAIVANRTTRSLRRQLAAARDDLEAASWFQRRAEGRLQITAAALQRHIAHLESIRKNGFWFDGLELALSNLKKLVNDVPYADRPANTEGRV